MSSELDNPIWAAYDLPRQESATPDSAARSPAISPSYLRMLLENDAWFCSLRWLVIAAFLALAVLARALGDVLLLRGIHLAPGWPLGVALVLALFNFAYLAKDRTASSESRLAQLAWRGLWLQILLDLAVLTVVVHYLGSLETYAPFMYLFHIVLACIFFPYAQSLLVTLAAMGMYLGCIVLETTGVVPHESLWAGSLLPDRGAAPLWVAAWQVGWVLFISVTVWYLASRLASALRRRDEELAATNRRLLAATEERARYMLRTTHQLKAPFAAIQANAQLLQDGYCGAMPAPAGAVVEQISARCELLSRQITAMLQLANLRSGAQQPPPPALLDLPALVRSCLANFRSEAAGRGIALEEDLAEASVWGVRDHLLMMIDNILSNAIHYSHDGQPVSVACRAGPNLGAVLVVRDRGIGIPADKLPRIFDDYYRTKEAVQHNKASTGLGLAIVRQAALAGHIGVRVESAPGRGTVFSLKFPPAPHEPEKTN